MKTIDINTMNAQVPVTDYLGEDGLLYCGTCHEAKEERFPEGFRLLGGKDTHPRLCACERARREKEERENEARRHIQEVERLRRSCFADRCQYDMTFDSSALTHSQIETCRRYAENWDEVVKGNFGLLFWGDVGTGKSYLAACIANALIEKEVSVRMLNFGQILNAGFEEKARILGDLSKYGLLILDDFGMERETEYGQEIVFQVIDNRYQCRKPMIITTNLSLKTLSNPKDLEHERIYGRILEACIPIHFDGENLREKERQKKVREFRKLIIDRGKAGGGGDERD